MGSILHQYRVLQACIDFILLAQTRPALCIATETWRTGIKTQYSTDFRAMNQLFQLFSKCMKPKRCNWKYDQRLCFVAWKDKPRPVNKLVSSVTQLISWTQKEFGSYFSKTSTVSTSSLTFPYINIVRIKKKSTQLL